jgi:hypothetical protein
MPTIAEVRQQYPQYSDMSDADLAGVLHSKFYSDMPREEFDKKVGLAPAEPPKHKFGLGDTWPARLAKGIYSAVTLPGDVMQGNVSMTGEDGHTNPEVINRSAELASVASPMSPAARSGIGWAGALKTKEAPAPTEEMLANASNSGYDAARNSPLEMKSDAVRNWAAKTQADLEAEGRLREFAPDTHAVLNKLQSGDPEAIATGGNLISAREALREASRNFTNPREKAAAEIAIRKLDGFIENPPSQAVLAGDAAAFAKTAADARGNYAAKSRSELLSQALEYADQKAAKNNSGANVGNAERDRLFNIYQSDKKSAGFTDDELAQIDQIIRGTPLANATRTMGNALGGGGGLGAAVTAGLGGAATAHMGGIGAVAPVVGYGLKKYSDSLGQKEINLLQEMVRRRSPLGETMPDRMVGSVSPEKAALARALMLGATPQQ